MNKLFELVTDEEKRTPVFIVLSGISLVISFFNIGNLPVDAGWLAVLLCGLPIIKGAVEGLITEFDIKADVLVAMAIVAAVLIGEIFAAGEVAFIMAVGAFLEELTVAKARAGIEKLVHLTPRTARVVRDGIETVILADQVQVGDNLRVLAGETVAVDGVITAGHTSINQSVMTGESLPVDKGISDDVFSGTVNQFGTFDMRATKIDKDSAFQRMVQLVESVDPGEAKIVRMADRWATWIVVIALTSAAGTWFLTGEIIRAVTILVVFCPCSLVLATPTAIMAGIGNATKYGILVRQGDALEKLTKITKIVFDKTGTLTYGKPVVAAVQSFNEAISSEKLLEMTAAAELRSEHPLGKAVVSHYKKVSDTVLPEPEEFELLAGRGVRALVGGREILAGNQDYMAENSIKITQAMQTMTATFQNEGCTIIYIVVNHQAAGFVALSDSLRADAAAAVKNLQDLDTECILLTGDNPQAARRVAKSVGISQVVAECLPEDKLSAIEKYQSNNDMVCMIGDGINDAPALKKGYVGIAMGKIGSDIAIDAADITLVNDDIQCIPYLIKLSRKTMRTIKLNLTFSMALNFAAIAFAMAGLLGPVLGAMVHNTGSVLVIINSALLLNYKNEYQSNSSKISTVKASHASCKAAPEAGSVMD